MDRTKKGSKKGWGRKVLLGSSPMGWSDEILGSVSTDDELENDVNAPENIGKESKFAKIGPKMAILDLLKLG